MNETTKLNRDVLYAKSPASSIPALVAGTYIIKLHDEDGETLLENTATGELRDPNSLYPWSGEWRKDGEIVCYGDLKDDDVAELTATVFFNLDDKETLFE